MNRSESLPGNVPGQWGFNRFNQILAVVLIVQLVIAALVFWPRIGGGGQSGELLLGGLGVDGVAAVTFIDDQEQELTLERSADGWVLAGTDGFPANAGTINTALTALTEIDTNRLVTRTDESHRRLQVAADDFLRQIRIERQDGQVDTLYVGSSPNVGATHVRLDGQPETYLAGNVNVWQLNATPATWIDTLYLSMVSSDIQTFELVNTQGRFYFERDADGTWTFPDVAAGEEFLPNNVSSLVTQISSVRMQTPLGTTAQPEYGLDSPQATVTVGLEREDGSQETISLAVGNPDEDGNYVIKASNSPYYVRVTGFTVDQFLERGRDAFLAQPDDAASDGNPAP